MRQPTRMVVWGALLCLLWAVVYAWLQTRSRPTIQVRGSDLYSCGTVRQREKIAHRFVLANPNGFSTQIDVNSEQCCTTIRASTTQPTILADGTAEVEVFIDTVGRSAGYHCESACIVTRHNGQECKTWLSLEYTISAPPIQERDIP